MIRMKAVNKVLMGGCGPNKSILAIKAKISVNDYGLLKGVIWERCRDALREIYNFNCRTAVIPVMTKESRDRFKNKIDTGS